MRPDVLVGIAKGRADLISEGKEPPFSAHLPPRRAARLRREMEVLGVSFGIALSGRYVPEPREDEYEWIYLGIILSDVHVFEREG